MIEVSSVHKYFGKFHVLNDISFFAEQGDIIGILGPNGAGKTTLMRILGCYMPPSHGRIKINSLDTTTHSLEIRHNLGYFQERSSMYPEMRVASFLKFMADLKNMPKNQKTKQVDKIIGQCGLEDVKNRIIGSLSKGYQQRVGLAQAFLNEPKFLLLDEPTAGVDPHQVIDLRQIIKDFGHQRTILMSSHILTEISEICNKILILNKGKIVASDTPADLYAKYSDGLKYKVYIQTSDHSNVISSLEANKEIIAAHMAEQDTDNKDTTMKEYILTVNSHSNIFRILCNIANNNKWIINEMKSHTMSLENIFIKLTTEHTF